VRGEEGRRRQPVQRGGECHHGDIELTARNLIQRRQPLGDQVRVRREGVVGRVSQSERRTPAMLDRPAQFLGQAVGVPRAGRTPPPKARHGARARRGRARRRRQPSQTGCEAEVRNGKQKRHGKVGNYPGNGSGLRAGRFRWLQREIPDGGARRIAKRQVGMRCWRSTGQRMSMQLQWREFHSHSQLCRQSRYKRGTDYSKPAYLSADGVSFASIPARPGRPTYEMFRFFGNEIVPVCHGRLDCVRAASIGKVDGWHARSGCGYGKRASSTRTTRPTLTLAAARVYRGCVCTMGGGSTAFERGAQPQAGRLVGHSSNLLKKAMRKQRWIGGGYCCTDCMKPLRMCGKGCIGSNAPSRAVTRKRRMCWRTHTGTVRSAPPTGRKVSTG